MKKKLLASLLAVAMVLTAGCGSTGDENKPVDSTPSTEDSQDVNNETDNKADGEDAQTGEVPTIIWWNVGTLPENIDHWEEVVNEYLEEQIGVRVDYRAISWGDWGTKHNTIINSGEYFDIMFTDLSIYNQYVAMGAFADLTELLPKAAPDLYAYIPEEVWKGVTSPKGMYAIPTYKDCARTSFYVFDKSYVDKYNIDYASIDTMEELDGYFQTVKAGEGKNYYPLQMTTATLWNGMFEQFDTLGTSLDALGIAMDDDSYTVVNTLEQPVIMDELKMLHKWYKDGIVNPDANVQTETNRQRPFFKGVGWPGATSVWEVSEGVDEYVSSRAFGPVYTTDSIQGALNSISANSQHKEEALKLLEFVNLDHKARDMFAYGIEGENFEYVEDNVIRKLNDTFDVMSIYSQATFFSLSTVEGNQKDQYEEIKAQNAEAFTSPMLGFTMDLEPVMNEVSACKTAWKKYSNDLFSGAADPEEVIPQLLKELDQVGLQTVIDEAQKQVNEYLGK